MENNTNTIVKAYSFYDLGYTKSLLKDDAFYNETNRVATNIENAVNPALVGSGEYGSTTVMSAGSYASSNYKAGVSGWALMPTLAEFNDVTVRGILVAGQIHIPDQNTTANSFHVQPDGDTWWGCTETNFNADPTNAKAYVLKSGAARFAEVIITNLQLGSDLNGTYITNLSITAGKIANATITSTQIASATITATNIANATITATQIANATITASQIANSTITTNQISGTAGITGSQIANSTITADNLANLTITASKIAGLTITAAEIANLTINGTKIAAGSITAVKTTLPVFILSAGTFTNNSPIAGKVAWAGVKIAYNGTENTITDSNTDKKYIVWDSGTPTALSGSDNVPTATTTWLVGMNLSGTYTSVWDMTQIRGDQIEAATITGTQIANATIAAGNIANGTITALQIANATITGTQLANNTIAATHIVNATITSSQIALATITASNIANNTITANQIAALTISAAEIANLTITSGKIADVSIDKLTAGTITSKTMTLAVAGGTGDVYIAAGKTDFNNTQNGFILGIDDSDSDRAKFYIGDSTYYLNWNGVGLDIKAQTSNLMLYECVVDAGGYGDYTSISAAVTAGKKRIFVRNGSYTETSTISLGPNVIITGEERDSVIITLASTTDDYLFDISNNQTDQNMNTTLENMTMKGDMYQRMDYYDSANKDSDSYGVGWHYGQAFANTNAVMLLYCTFNLKRTGSPAGNITAYLYASTGTYGTDAKPTGAALATSDPVVCTTISNAGYVDVVFLFTGANQITLSANTKYCIVVSHPSGDASNYISHAIDATNPGHAGNYCFSSDGVNWFGDNSADIPFYVYGRRKNTAIYASGRYTQINRCTFTEWGADVIIFPYGTFSGYYTGWNLVEGCHFYANYDATISLGGYHNQILNNSFRENQRKAHTCSGTTAMDSTIEIQSSKYGIIRGNRSEDDMSSFLLLYGVDNVISENVVVGCGAGDYADVECAAITTPHNTVDGGVLANTVSANIIDDCPYGIAFRHTSGNNRAYRAVNTIIGNTITRCQRSGIWLEYCQVIVVNGNNLNSNCQGADNTYSEILIDNSYYCTINGNVVLCSSEAVNAQYGIYLTAGSDTNIVIANQVYNAQTANIQDSGATNDVNHNKS